MSRFEEFAHGLRESLDGLSEGWQDLWQKARNAVTRFTPFQDDQGETHPGVHHTSRWGVMSAELRETGSDLVVELEAPGMKRDDFDIQVDGRYVRIRGRKHFADDRKEGRYHITERAYGAFERIIPLPAEVDTGTARYADGVLTVTLPKVEQHRVKRIQVD